MDGGLSSGGYTVGEVVFLLGLTEHQALGEDASFRSCLADVTEDGHSSSTSHAEFDPVPTYARWSEVQRARARVAQSKLDSAIVGMRAQGFTEREISEQLDVSQPTVHRHFRARLNEIVAELGGVLAPEDRTSTVSACLLCAQRPRTRLAAVRRRVRGGWKILAPERYSSLCVQCTPPERLHLLLHPPAPVNQDGEAGVGCV
jgi:DNA-binding transcriptional ArsR family regulator